MLLLLSLPIFSYSSLMRSFSLLFYRYTSILRLSCSSILSIDSGVHVIMCSISFLLI